MRLGCPEGKNFAKRRGLGPQNEKGSRPKALKIAPKEERKFASRKTLVERETNGYASRRKLSKKARENVRRKRRTVVSWYLYASSKLERDGSAGGKGSNHQNACRTGFAEE